MQNVTEEEKDEICKAAVVFMVDQDWHELKAKGHQLLRRLEYANLVEVSNGFVRHKAKSQ